MSLDIVIVDFQTPADLQQCLASLVQNAPTVPFTVLVILNEPTPEDVMVADRFCTANGWDREVMPNNGYAYACNYGGSIGEADVMAFFNADVEFTPGILDACHDALLANDRWGILGPRQVNRDGAITHAGIFGTHAQPALRGWKRRTDEFQEVQDDAISVSGSAYFVKRACWTELVACERYQEIEEGAVGAFLPVFHYYEETWCSYHAWSHGWQVVYWGANTMIHQWHQASPLGGFADQQMVASREIFRNACNHHSISHD